MSKTKNIKSKALFSLLLMSVLCTANFTSVLAKEPVESKIKTYTFETKDKTETHPEKFEKTISDDGKTYTLGDITYTIKDKKAVETEKTVTKEVESDYIADGTEYVPQQTISENGITYTYSSKNAIESNQVVSSQQVTGYTDYDYEVSAAGVPQTKDIIATDQNGQQHTVSCNLINVQQLDTGEWINTYIDITFISYDSQIFEWNGIEVTKNESNPLQGYEAQLLASVGANTTDYRINNVYWNGDTYTTSDGTICRNATASVQRYVRYYRANYSGTLDTTGTKYRVVYTGTEKVKSDTEFNYNIEASANYTLVQSTPVIYYIMAGIGILLVIALIVLLLYVIAKKKKKEETSDENK